MANWKWNTTNQPAPPQTKEELSAMVQQMGGVGFREAFPQTYNPTYRWYQDAKYGAPVGVQGAMDRFQCGGCGGGAYDAEIESLKEIKKQFPGVEATYIRWLIDKKIEGLSYRGGGGGGISRRQAGIKLGQAEQGAMEQQVPVQWGGAAPMMEPGEALPGKTVSAWTPSQEYIEQAGPRVGAERVAYLQGLPSQDNTVAKQKEIGLPIPDWMRPYLESSISYKGPEGQQGSQAPTLRPMGAQAELTPTQMGQMAGYEAYTRAGAPTSYSEEALIEMADWEKWWEPYTRLSQSLFPSKVKLTPRWMPAFQR